MSTTTTRGIALGFALLCSLAGCGKNDAGNVRTPTQFSEAARKSTPTIGLRWSIADREKWNANDFFDSENELKICELISSRNTGKLRIVLEQDVELNTPGKFGFTVLYWAFVESEMEAFELLLKSGADPDHRLTDFFRWSPDGAVECSSESSNRFTPFFKGDSVLFTGLRCWRPQFCEVALRYSQDAQQLDRNGENLLHAFLQPGSGGKETLQAIIDAGVGMNLKGRNGDTPCHRALSMQPRYCLQLLEAGADPSVQNDSGRDVADCVELKLSASIKTRQPDKSLDLVAIWLTENYREVRPIP